MIIRKHLNPDEVYPSNLRYNSGTDGVEITFDGGETWYPAGDLDPRHQTHLPPPDTADPQCDAAATMTALIHQMVDKLIADLASGFAVIAIVTAILAILSALLGLFVLIYPLIFEFVAFAAGVGSGVIDAAFDEDAYADILCYLRCHISPDGTITALGVELAKEDIDANMDSTVAAVMDYVFQILGEGGLNDAAAAVGTIEGDCSGCAVCAGCLAWLDGDDNAGDWTFQPYNGTYGVYNATEDRFEGVWIGIPGSGKNVTVRRTFPTALNVTDVYVGWDDHNTRGVAGVMIVYRDGVAVYVNTSYPPNGQGFLHVTLDGTACNSIDVLAQCRTNGDDAGAHIWLTKLVICA